MLVLWSRLKRWCSGPFLPKLWCIGFRNACDIICWCKSANNFLINSFYFLVATTESIKVDLTNGCWGNVNVCMGKQCGGVCKDTWSDQKSEMLCENLGCGNTILTGKNPLEKSGVMVKSFHTTTHTTNLNQSIMVKSNERDTTCIQNAVYVVCSGNGQIFINAIIIIQS